jgi:hypothetical protein
VRLQLDASLLADALTFYFEKLHKILGLYSAHCWTISGAALTAMLHNCKDPVEKGSSLGLQMLGQDVYQHFEASLCGGYRSCHV